MWIRYMIYHIQYRIYQVWHADLILLIAILLTSFLLVAAQIKY
jgi:hypothetical protein